MGYKKGEGLGKDKSGITRPIETKLAGKKGMGVMIGEEIGSEKRKAAEEEKIAQESLKIRPIKSVKQLINENPDFLLSGPKTSSNIDGQGAAGQKIIDKTTAVEKVYDDYNAFGSQISSSNLSLFSADTQGCVHNLDTLIQDLENKILTSHFK